MAPEGDPRDPVTGLPLHRHGLGFLCSGLLAFATNAMVLELIVWHFGAPPLVAQVPAVAVSMVVGWLAHRRLTFAIRTEPTVAEFLRYALAGSMSVIINYALFAILLLIAPSLHHQVALILSAGGTMIFSYLAMRYAVFRKP